MDDSAVFTDRTRILPIASLQARISQELCITTVGNQQIYANN